MAWTLHATLAADGASTAVDASGDIAISGVDDFGGGTLTAQISPDDGVTYFNVPDSAMVAATPSVIISVPVGSKLRVSLVGATIPTLRVYLSEAAGW